MAARTLLTLEEFERLPDSDGVRHELDEGELLPMTFPKPRHAAVEGNILEVLSAAAKRGRFGKVLSHTGFLLRRNPDTLRGPDIAFLRQPRAEQIDPDEFIEGAPDLAVEIVSPSESAEDLMRKVRQYLEAGGHTVWVVYPHNREVQVFEATGATRLLGANQPLDAPELLPGWSVRIAELFE